jgi:hypothetical protein
MYVCLLAMTVTAALTAPQFGGPSTAQEVHAAAHSYTHIIFGSQHKKSKTVIINKDVKVPVDKPFPVTVEKNVL